MQHHHFTLPGGQRLHYTAWGKPGAQAVVCVHGLTRNARDFDFLAQQLSDDFYVLCLDVLGRGESSWASEPEEYTLHTYAQQALAWLDGLNLSKPHWVGTSMGGLIALTLQMIAPQRFGQLVLNDVGPVIEMAALKRIAHYIGAAPSFDNRELAVAYAKTIFTGFGAKTPQQWAGLTDFYYVDDETGGVSMHYDPVIAQVTRLQVAGMSDQVIAASEAALWASLKSIAQPVLVLRGAQSDLLSPATVTAMCAANPLLKAIEISDCGHAPHLMDTAQAQLIHTFLKS